MPHFLRVAPGRGLVMQQDGDSPELYPRQIHEAKEAKIYSLEDRAKLVAGAIEEAAQLLASAASTIERTGGNVYSREIRDFLGGPLVAALLQVTPLELLHEDSGVTPDSIVVPIQDGITV